MDDTDREVAALITRLSARGTPLSRRRRRRALRRLAAVRTPEAVRVLALAYVSGRDKRVALTTAAAISDLDDPAAVDAVCEVLIATSDERLAELVAKAGYLPSIPERRALLLFLTGRFEEYAELDFDGTMLAAARAVADEGLRMRLAERARADGRTEWVRAIAAARGPDRAVALSDSEWRSEIELLVAAGSWEELWRLVLRAPPVWSARVLRELKRAGWRPASESDRTGFGELADLAQACSDDTLGDLLPDEPVQLSGHRKSVIAVAMAADLVASADNEGVVRLWRLPDGTAMAAPRIQRTHLQCMALSPDGALLATGGLPEHPEEAVQLWELPSGNQIHSRGARCHSLAVTPDGRLLVVGGDGTIDLWRLPDCTPVRNVSIHADHAVARLTMTADGGLLATCCQFGRIQFWRLPDLTPAGPMRGPASQFDLALTGDGGFLATANAGDAKLWRMPDLTPIGSASPTSARCLTATSDGRLLAAGLSNGAVAVSRMPYATQLRTLTGHAKGVRCLAVSPDGGFLASGGGDRMVLLWDLRLWRAVHTPIGALEPPAADFSGSAQVWALLVGALVRWRRRYDIEVDTVGPAATDIEVGRQGEGA